jgi:hypothetical protein
MLFCGGDVLDWGFYLLGNVNSLYFIYVSGSKLIKHSKYYKNYAILEIHILQKVFLKVYSNDLCYVYYLYWEIFEYRESFRRKISCKVDLKS